MPPDRLQSAAADNCAEIQRRTVEDRTPDFSRRAPLLEFPELMDDPCSREELRECLRDLAKVNRLLLGYRPILNWLDSLMQRVPSSPSVLRILDVGCGYGDTLRRIARWAKSTRISVDLVGLDISAETIGLAAEATDASLPIHYVAADLFAYSPERPPHVVLSSLFTHHLEDRDIIRFLDWVEQNAELGWCINDLSRHPTPYHLFRWFARLLRLHPYVQHDGPVSIARAFREEDWIRYCSAAGLNRNVGLRGFAPGRLRVSRIKL